MNRREDLCVRVAEILVGSAPILECAPQAAGHLGNIRLTPSDSGSRRTLVFRIQIATNEARNALPSFWGQWTGTSEFDQLVCGELLISPESAIRHTQDRVDCYGASRRRGCSYAQEPGAG